MDRSSPRRTGLNTLDFGPRHLSQAPSVPFSVTVIHLLRPRTDLGNCKHDSEGDHTTIFRLSGIAQIEFHLSDRTLIPPSLPAGACMLQKQNLIDVRLMRDEGLGIKVITP